MAKDNAKPGDVVELKDKEAGFTDPQTGFDISRDQRRKLKDPIGQRTHEAIMSGGLIVLKEGTKATVADDHDEETAKRQAAARQAASESDLPEDLPGRDAFLAAGLTKFESVQALKTDEELTAVKGITKKTVSQLKTWAEKNADKLK